MSTKNLFDLHGRRALVTGASRGIGLAIAQGLAERGAEVTLTGRKPDTLEAAVNQIKSQGGHARAAVCHQADSTAIAHLFQQLEASGTAPEIVVINAATNPTKGPLLDLDLSAWHKILDVNLTGALVTARHAALRMVKKKKGAILFIASVAGIDPIASIGAYSVSKAGMLGLMKVLARELGPMGIRVNALAPGLVETQFAAAFFRDRDAYDGIIAQTPLQRHAQPEDIVGAAVYLVSDAARHVTGQTLVIDGGVRM